MVDIVDLMVNLLTIQLLILMLIHVCHMYETVVQMQ